MRHYSFLRHYVATHEIYIVLTVKATFTATLCRDDDELTGDQNDEGG